MSDLCRDAILSVITFAQDNRNQFFTFHQANIVNDFLNKENSNRKTGASILTDLTRPFLNMIEHEKGKMEINHVENNFECIRDFFEKKRI